MLKTNTKKVSDRIKAHVLEYYETPEALRRDMEAVGGFTDYHKGQNLVDGGCFLCYNFQVFEFLKEALEETDDEALKYDEVQSWNLYRHLVGKACEKLVKNI